MWLYDKFGNGINSRQLLSLYVGTDPGNESYYEVQGNNSANTLSAQFTTTGTLDEAGAADLLTEMLTLLGVSSIGSS
jgi:hypothetical protein